MELVFDLPSVIDAVQRSADESEQDPVGDATTSNVETIVADGELDFLVFLKKTVE